MPGIAVRIAINVLGLWLASEMVRGMHISGIGGFVAAAPSRSGSWSGTEMDRPRVVTPRVPEVSASERIQSASGEGETASRLALNHSVPFLLAECRLADCERERCLAQRARCDGLAPGS